MLSSRLPQSILRLKATEVQGNLVWLVFLTVFSLFSPSWICHIKPKFVPNKILSYCIQNLIKK
jgi:hypothetical protein